jgi:hypothetical protein
LSKLPVFASKLGAGISSFSTRFLSVVGKVLGVGSSLLMGLIDFWRAGKEFSEGNGLVAVAYGVSGLLGSAATAFLFFGWTGIGLVVVAAIAWAFIMSNLIDDKLQDWLERYVFGKLTDQIYRDHATEIREFKVATS